MARAESVLATFDNGAALELLRVEETLGATRLAYWLRTINLRPVPPADAAAIADLRARQRAPGFRLHMLTRAQRQLDDLLRSPELVADAGHDLLPMCEEARAVALAEFAEGSFLSATGPWLSLGERFAQHPRTLDTQAAVAAWNLLAAGGKWDLAAAGLLDAVLADVRGCLRAQDAALADRAIALDRLRAAAKDAAEL